MLNICIVLTYRMRLILCAFLMFGSKEPPHSCMFYWSNVFCSYVFAGVSNKSVDSADGIAVLHALNTMVFHPQGKQAVIHVIALEDNLKLLLPFMRMAGEISHLLLFYVLCITWNAYNFTGTHHF